MTTPPPRSSRSLANIEGDANTAIGIYSLFYSTGNFNTALGEGAGIGVTTADNVICIGTVGVDVSNSCYIGNIAGQTVGLGGSGCYVDNDGKLGVFLSARRFKRDVFDMDNASAALLALRPVTFRYKPELDKIGIPQSALSRRKWKRSTLTWLRMIRRARSALCATRR